MENTFPISQSLAVAPFNLCIVIYQKGKRKDYPYLFYIIRFTIYN